MDTTENKPAQATGCGCYVVGMPVAAICSWAINHSLLWGIFHAFFWWAYIPYLCLGCGGGWPF